MGSDRQEVEISRSLSGPPLRFCVHRPGVGSRTKSSSPSLILKHTDCLKDHYNYGDQARGVKLLTTASGNYFGWTGRGGVGVGIR